MIHTQRAFTQGHGAVCDSNTFLKQPENPVNIETTIFKHWLIALQDYNSSEKGNKQNELYGDLVCWLEAVLE